jgi:aspartokinase-like uncharacterized kinase
MSGIHVLKVGGSLLTTDHLPDRILTFLTRHQITRALLVIGGGAAADEIRRRQNAENLSEERAHWLAIEAMAENSRRLTTQHSDYELVRTRLGAHNCWTAGKIPVIDPLSFLMDEELIVGALPLKGNARFSRRVLPASWSVTSDSIAAWIAARWLIPDISGAESEVDHQPTLWLLKSCSPGDRCDLPSLRERELVDDHFPAFASESLRIFWVNLRNDDLTSIQRVEIQSHGQNRIS